MRRTIYVQLVSLFSFLSLFRNSPLYCDFSVTPTTLVVLFLTPDSHPPFNVPSSGLRVRPRPFSECPVSVSVRPFLHTGPRDFRLLPKDSRVGREVHRVLLYFTRWYASVYQSSGPTFKPTGRVPVRDFLRKCLWSESLRDGDSINLKEVNFSPR